MTLKSAEKTEAESSLQLPSGLINLQFNLHPQQANLLNTTATEILFGGAAGGGKSFLTRVLSILWCVEIPGLNVFLFRRLYDDLIKNHVEGPTGYRAMLAPWLNAKHPQSPLLAGRVCEMLQTEIRFWNGSKIFLCHLQHQKDITKYYGPEFHVLFIEEATQFTEFMIRFLRGRLRIPDALKIPDKYKKPEAEWRDPKVPDYYFPRAIYTSNPGGVGHAYLKRSFITGFKPLQLHKAPDDDGGHTRMYVPAKVDDNPSVNREQVKEQLRGLPPALVNALLLGDWNAVVGAFFPEPGPQHVVPNFQIPDYWPRFMSMDWGACGEGDPFAIGWWTVSDGTYLPRGSLICYRRWYGRGLPKVTAHMVALGIKEREQGEKIVARHAGGDILEKRGTGPSLFEIFAGEGIHFQRADMRRINGWAQVRERLVGKNGKPLLYWTEETSESLELLGNLQHDINNPSDIAPGDDHEADMIRYMCMSRPFTRNMPAAKLPQAERFKMPTMDEAWSQREQRNNPRR
jgi:hypothetical protein